ncbi:unnamed protein product [Boreogadus saida]
MSWLLAVWISLGFLLACQATLYQTIQQHHVARPGRTDILTLAESYCQGDRKYARLRCLVLVQGNGNRSGLTEECVSDQTIDLAY